MGCIRHGAYVEVRRQLAGAGEVFEELNSGCQAWQQAPFSSQLTPPVQGSSLKFPYGQQQIHGRPHLPLNVLEESGMVARDPKTDTGKYWRITASLGARVSSTPA